MLVSLDFDGVLHSLTAAHAVHDTALPVPDLLAAGLFLHNHLLESRLAQHVDVEIVVHSSWRFMHNEARLREMLGPLGHRMRGVTTKAIEGREASILDTLRRWNVSRSKVLVLDDDHEAFTKLADRLVRCDAQAGVSSASTLTAIDSALRAGLVNSRTQRLACSTRPSTPKEK